MEQVGDTEAAQQYFRRAIEISRACLAKKPDSDAYKSELANSLGQLARSELTLGHLEKARELYREEIAVRESFSPAQANDWESRRELAGLYAELAATERAGWATRTKPSASTTKVRVAAQTGRGGTARLLAGPERPRPVVQQSRVHAFPQGHDPAARDVPPQGPRCVQETGQGRPG